MYLALMCLAVTASALPVPDESAKPIVYSPVIMTAPDSTLRTNLLATVLLPSDDIQQAFDLKRPFIQITRKTSPKIEPVLEIEANTANCKPPASNVLFSSGSDTLNMDDKEPEKMSDEVENEKPLEPAEIETEEMSEPEEPINNKPEDYFEPIEPMDTKPEESFEPKEPMDNKPEESFEPKEPMDNKPEESFEPEEPIDNKPEESSEPQKEIIEEFSDKEPLPELSVVAPAVPIITVPAPEPNKPINKPRPPIFSFKPPFFSFLSPSWYSGSRKFSLSSLPLISSLNLQAAPELTSSTLSSLGLSNLNLQALSELTSSTLTNLGLPLPGISSEGGTWISLLPFLNNRDKNSKIELPSGRSVLVYVKPMGEK